MVINVGYAGAEEGIVSASLDRDEVEKWGFAALPGEVTVEGESLPAVAGRPVFDELSAPVAAGSYPTGDDEVALGIRSAELLELAVDDRVDVTTAFGERDATVAGLVVLPSVGPFHADRVGLGTGALLSSRFFDAVVAGAEQERGLPPGALSGALGAFVAIDLRDGVDAGAFVREPRSEVEQWDADGFPPIVYPGAVRPPEIADVAAVRTAPVLLAALLDATMAMAMAITVATRARVRDSPSCAPWDVRPGNSDPPSPGTPSRWWSWPAGRHPDRHVPGIEHMEEVRRGSGNRSLRAFAGGLDRPRERRRHRRRTRRRCHPCAHGRPVRVGRRATGLVTVSGPSRRRPA